MNEEPEPRLGRRAAGGAVYIGGAQAARVILMLLSTVIVARVLSPSDYGVIAMSFPISAFLMIFQNIGLNQAVIQWKTLDDRQLDAMFWFTMLASTTIALLLLAISPAVAWFYDDIRPAYIVAASSITALLTGAALQHNALLSRSLRFRTIALIDIAATVMTFIVTIALALVLRSYWALWLGTFSGVVVSLIATWLADRWRPGFHIRAPETRAMLAFGRGLTVSNVLNFMSRSLDNVLIAYQYGAFTVGLYDRAYKLMLFPIQNINAPLSRVMLPVLGKLRSEPERFRRAYLSALQAIELVAIPGVAVGVATSDRLIPWLLGPNWAGASPIFFWLSLAALIQPLAGTSGWLFVASRRTGAMLRYSLFSSSTTLLSFVIGLQWGPAGLAAAYFVGSLLRAPILYVWCVRGTPVKARDLFTAQFMSSVGAGITYLIVRAIEDDLETLPLLCAGLAVSYGVALLLCAVTPRGREFLGTVREVAFKSR